MLTDARYFALRSYSAHFYCRYQDQLTPKKTQLFIVNYGEGTYLEGTYITESVAKKNYYTHTSMWVTGYVNGLETRNFLVDPKSTTTTACDILSAYCPDGVYAGYSMLYVFRSVDSKFLRTIYAT